MHYPWRSLSICAVIVASFSLATIGYAQTNEQARELEVQGVRITPFIFEQTVQKGESFSGEITLTNTTAAPVILSLAIRDFIPAGRHGEVRFLPANQETDPHFSLSHWVEILEQPDYTLGPGQSTHTTFRISAPADADDGTHYGGILFSFNEGKSQNGTTVIQSVGAILIAKIGYANGSGTVETFSTPQHTYTSGAIPFMATFRNTGNVHLSPKGKIEIKNIFGKIVGLSYINENAQISLPNTVRQFESFYKGKFMAGKYTATLTLVFGNPKLEAKKTITFWVLPWKPVLKFGLLGTIALALLIFAIIRYNTWVIKHAHRP